MNTEKKIDHRKKYLLCLDIETANMVEDAIAYDIGFCVCDRHGNIYEKYSFMVAEMFFNYTDLMNTAYYAEKIPSYWIDLAKGSRKMASILTVRKIICRLMKEYKIDTVCAYNSFFDKTGLDRTIRYLTKSDIRYFFPYGTKICCIWNMACQVICDTKSYVKYAIDNQLISASGNMITNAEAVYRFLTKDNEFVESHTGLEDVLIETAIMKACYDKHKKMNTGIYRACWQIPQKRYKMTVSTI